MIRREEYATGRTIDIHGDGGQGIALLWHGRGPNERAALAPLAEVVAAAGVCALVPDWNSEAADGGKSELLATVRYARNASGGLGIQPERLVMVGWSLGGTAALGLAVHASRYARISGRTILIAPGSSEHAVDPMSGQPLPATFPTGVGQPTIDMLYGSRDEVVESGLVVDLESRLRKAGWGTTLKDLDAGHTDILSAPEVAAAIVAAATSLST